MRTIILTSLAAAGFVAATALPAPALAAPISPSSGIVAAAQENSLIQEAAYVCRRVWRYGRWERRCWWRPGPNYYGGYGYYGPRPYYGYRHGWRPGPHRYWRRW
jgi:hypothetical protein